jgi:hypothetical protein
VSEARVVETQKQHAKVRVVQSFSASITITGVEAVVVPNINVVRRGVLTGSATNWVMDQVEFRQFGI